ncbi:MAG: sulfurtransferase [Pseudomonadota bacterium]
MTYETLVDVATLKGHLADPSFRVVDCRFELGNPDAGRALYLSGHLPGAVYAHLDADLSGPRTPWSGRHPLPEPEDLALTLGRLGINDSIQVVAYDESNGAYAARLWWLLRWLGHRRVAVLDGGLAAWRAAALPLSVPPVSVGPRHFVARPDATMHVSGDDVARLVARNECVLLDARAPERYEGRLEPLDPQAGHVPGARNHHFARNLAQNGNFLGPEALAAVLTRQLHGHPPTEAISMCGSGVTACHTLLALEIAGLTGARLYPGSWSEWSRDPGRTVAVGP